MATLGHEIIHQAGTGFDRVISVGDGPWDLRAAIATGSQFIGIGESTAPFGAWFPRTHLFASLDDIDPTTDFTVAPPAGQVAEPDADKAFTARPPRAPAPAGAVDRKQTFRAARRFKWEPITADTARDTTRAHVVLDSNPNFSMMRWSRSLVPNRPIVLWLAHSDGPYGLFQPTELGEC